MVNNIVLVGRIANGLEIKNTKNGNVANISVAVQSKRKNSEGIYKTNFFDCELWGKKAEKTVDYFKIRKHAPIAFVFKFIGDRFIKLSLCKTFQIFESGRNNCSRYRVCY